ncbi:MAG: ABC transporter permease [Gemmatimonadaceae bacterium]
MARDARHPIVELTTARFKEFLREPEAVFWTFIFPILLAAGLGIAFRSRPAEHVKLAILESPRRQQLEPWLRADSSLTIEIMDDSAAARALRIGDIALLVAPGAGDTVEYRFDPAREDARTARLIVDRILQRNAGTVGVVPVRESHISERGSRYIDFVVPGLLGMNIMGSSVWGIGFAIVDARRKRLLKRFVATPMRRPHYLMSFLLMRLTLMVVEVTVIAAFAVLAFGVPLRGALWQLALVAVVSALAFGGIGLFIAARARTIEGASGLMNVVMLPMWVGSGVFFSASNFPDAVQPFIQALPLTAAVDAFRANMLQGGAWSAVGPELLILGVWFSIPFVAALRMFRWQ